MDRFDVSPLRRCIWDLRFEEIVVKNENIIFYAKVNLILHVIIGLFNVRKCFDKFYKSNII